MTIKFPRTKLTILIGAISLSVGCLMAYAAINTGNSAFIGLWEGPATIVANDNNVTGKGVTGGWHYHPGYMYNVVKQGTVTIEDGCAQPDDADPEEFGTRTYTAGQAFEKADGRVHRAVNHDADVDEIEVSMTIVPPGVPPRVPATGSLPVKRCGPARSVNECKAYWQRFDFPYAFNNRGECVAFVNNRRRVTVLAPDYSPDVQ